MKDFAAIDFETANGYRSSVCSVGVVIVRDGAVVDRYYSLIRPYPDYFTYWTTRVHGLTMEDVEDAPDFPAVWRKVELIIRDLPLVAHNSPFDEGCLRAVFREYSMDYPDYEFYCTCRASNDKLGNILPNHQLQTVSAYCGTSPTTTTLSLMSRPAPPSPSSSSDIFAGVSKKISIFLLPLLTERMSDYSVNTQKMRVDVINE